MTEPNDSTAIYERQLLDGEDPRVELRLFVAGLGMRSSRAIVNLARLCEEFTCDPASVTIVDIYEHPDAAAEAQIIAVPTLVRDRPKPERRLIGAIGDLPRIALSLGFLPRGRGIEPAGLA